MTSSGAVGPFAFGGRLSLDLTWTLRYRNLRPVDMLTGGEALASWLAHVEITVPSAPTERQLVQALALREAIYRAAVTVSGGNAPAATDVDVVNEMAAHPNLFVQYDGGQAALQAPAGNEVGAALSTIARDAVEVLAAGDGRLRLCAGTLCGLVFYDSSRPGNRRWCSAQRCGNRASTRAHRARAKQA